MTITQTIPRAGFCGRRGGETEVTGEEKFTATWKLPGLYKADAQTVASEIIEIGESATPAQILEKARDESSELHLLFEWDDSVAAEKYRLYQAKQIVCNLVIKETVSASKPPIRFFCSPVNGSGYRKTYSVFRNQDQYQTMLNKLTKEAKAWSQRAKRFSELEEIVTAVERYT